MWILLLVISIFQMDDYEKAIKETNKQRVLLQQMVKEYTFVIAGVYFKNNRQTFKESTTKFEERMYDLTNGNRKKNLPFAPTYDLIQLYEKTNFQWRKFKAKFTSSDFLPILTLEKIIDNQLKDAGKKLLQYTKDEEITLSDIDLNILHSERGWYLSEKLIKETVLYMLEEDMKAQAFTTKNMFQEHIQYILDKTDKSDPNFPVIEDIQTLWRSFDDDLLKVLKENDRNKIYIMNLHKTQTLLLKRIDHYKEVEHN